MISRRSILRGLLAAPAVVAAGSLMPLRGTLMPWRKGFSCGVDVGVHDTTSVWLYGPMSLEAFEQKYDPMEFSEIVPEGAIKYWESVIWEAQNDPRLLPADAQRIVDHYTARIEQEIADIIFKSSEFPDARDLVTRIEASHYLRG